MNAMQHDNILALEFLYSGKVKKKNDQSIFNFPEKANDLWIPDIKSQTIHFIKYVNSQNQPRLLHITTFDSI